MPYQFPVDLEALAAERRPQMVNRGLPEADVDGLFERVNDMWGAGSGAWVQEWLSLANGYKDSGESGLALLALGYAKFPTLADDGRRTAYREQVALCVALAEADADTCAFERRIIEIDHDGQTVPVAVHQYSAPGKDLGESPVLIASGGVDMWKEDLHAVWSACVTWAGVSVLAFDIPGTGESTIPMSLASTAIVSGLVQEARNLGNGKVAHFGISMGGYFAARTGLTGEVDAAVVLGGPVRAAFGDKFADLTRGTMTGILGNTLGFDAPPTLQELEERWNPMSLSTVLETQDFPTPMLVINGDNDPLIPQEDTLLFDGRAGAEAHLIPNSGHCAAEKTSEVTPMIIGWLAKTMAETPAQRPT